MYSTVFIDLDDTIWDTYSNGKESMAEIYSGYKFDRFFPDFDTFYNIYYPNNCLLWEKYREGKISKDELIIERIRFPLRPYIIYSDKEILAINDDFLHRTTKKTQLLPYTFETLDYLKPKYRLYILSNGFREVQYQKMDNSGLSPYFEDVILSDNVGYTKPHSKIFEEALRIAKVDKAEAIMLGDSWDADIVGAKKAGIDQIWYDLGIEVSKGFTPTYRITSLRELRQIL